MRKVSNRRITATTPITMARRAQKAAEGALLLGDVHFAVLVVPHGRDLRLMRRSASARNILVQPPA